MPDTIMNASNVLIHVKLLNFLVKNSLVATTISFNLRNIFVKYILLLSHISDAVNKTQWV